MRALAPDMRCKPEFITGQKKNADHTSFAAFVRNLTPAALSLNVPLGTLDRLPQMTASAHQALRDRNRYRYTVSQAEGAAAQQAPPAADQSKTCSIPEDGDDWNSGTRTQ